VRASSDGEPLYRCADAALLRAAAAPMQDAPDSWPDPGNLDACRTWLHSVWLQQGFADAIRQASPGLAERVDEIRVGRVVPAKQVRRATLSTIRYVLRASSRPTPFGLFAGVAPVSFGPLPQVRWRSRHRAAARRHPVVSGRGRTNGGQPGSVGQLARVSAGHCPMM